VQNAFLEDRVKGREPQRELTEFQRGLERAAKANAVRERARARQKRKQGPATKAPNSERERVLQRSATTSAFARIKEKRE
jgi:hypothetical protein